MWRKTRSKVSGSSCVGVDPNRNWDAGFGGERCDLAPRAGPKLSGGLAVLQGLCSALSLLSPFRIEAI